MYQEDRSLKIEDVSFVYDGEMRPVWEHLSICFPGPGVHAVCGPSGCGKSSLLYLVDGLIPQMREGSLSGRVYLSSEDITKLPPRELSRSIGFVMQSPESQFCTFTVAEELAFGMENLGLPQNEMKRRISQILDAVGLPGLEDRRLSTLSGGQKQKIAIAAVLVMSPKILLLDEPTANLDPVSRKEILDLILNLQRERLFTVIIVEHNIAEIIDAVDSLTVFDENGAVISTGCMESDKTLVIPELEPETTGFAPPDSSEPILEIKNLSFSYPGMDMPVLADFDLSINRGDFLAVLGANGTGKTTLLKLIFQILKQNSGQISFQNKPVSSIRKKTLYESMGLVFQNPEDQFVANTVHDEMFFSLKRTRTSREVKEARIKDMLSRFHLEETLEKSPFILSQGQKRRLSVAVMLLTGQKLLFLDEPTFGQDHENREELMKDMQTLAADGVTVVMITHDLSLVQRYASRVVEISDGKVLYDMPAEQYFLPERGL